MAPQMKTAASTLEQKPMFWAFIWGEKCCGIFLTNLIVMKCECPLSWKLLLPLWSKSLCSELREDEASETYYDNVQLLQTQNLTGYRTPNDDIQTRLGSALSRAEPAEFKREVENEA